jgi:hypothetical protein
MKTELLHSYSSASLSALAKSESTLTLSNAPDANGTAAGGVRSDTLGSGTLLGNLVREFKTKVFKRKTVNFFCSRSSFPFSIC